MTPAQLDALVEGEVGLRPPADPNDIMNAPRTPGGDMMQQQLALHRRILAEGRGN